MNCDLVFEILTRGPFPSGAATDAAVELHLTRCHECRQLAEALRPAIELFHETLGEGEDVRSLPGYYGAAGAEETATAAILTSQAWPSRAARNEPGPAPSWRMRRRTRRSSGPIGQMACGAGLGAALCLLLAFWVTSAASRPSPMTTNQAPASLGAGSSRIVPPEEARVVLAALQLPLFCVRPADSESQPWKATPRTHEDAAPRTAGVLLCCTHCHNAAEPRPAVSAVALLQREACGACHRWQ